jgi:hypothetical protein
MTKISNHWPVTTDRRSKRIRGVVRSVLLCALAVGMIVGSAPELVSALACSSDLSELDCKAINGGWENWIPETNVSACGDTGAPPDISSVEPGQGAPNGLTYPNLATADITKAIDTFIQKHQPHSPLKGTAAFAIASGTAANVNPFMVYATALKESSLGVWADSGSSLKAANNSFGRRASSSQPNVSGWYKWSSIPASINKDAPENSTEPNNTDWITYVRKVYSSELNQGPRAFIMKYAPPSENDTETYINQYQGFLNEMARYAGATDIPDVPTSSPDSGSDSVDCSGDSDSGDIGVGTGKFTDSGQVAHADTVLHNAQVSNDHFGTKLVQDGWCATIVSRVWSNGANSYGYPYASDVYYKFQGTSTFHANRNPEVGAILIYAGHGAGHVTIYLGNNKILNDGAIADASAAEGWGGGYKGWVDPNDLGWHTSPGTESSIRNAVVSGILGNGGSVPAGV